MMKNKKKYGKPKFVLLTILCFVLTMVLSLALMVSLNLRTMVQEESLPTAVGQVELARIPVDGATMAEYVHKYFIQDERVSLESVEKVMKEGTFSEFTAELTERYNTYLREGGEFPTVSADEFVRLIEENEELILEETGLRFLEPDKQKLRESMSDMVEEWNAAAADTMHKGVKAFAVKAVLSIWLPIVLGVLLLALLVWMIVIHVRSTVSAGKAFKTYGVAVFIPSVLMTALSILSDIIVAVKLPVFGRADNFLYEAIGVYVLGILAAAVIFGIGILCNLITSGRKKPQTAAASSEQQEEIYDGFFGEAKNTAAEEAPQPVEEAEEQAQRKFCRNCGQPLVNPDAKFCYKCGNVQEHVKTEE
ncbi:MAG: zinc ribbon domain-containing protein [Oscillospiraceae bacterium]|nr:zinc ribbon domain-containing protein [Oscillospiraceae bacterium]